MNSEIFYFIERYIAIPLVGYLVDHTFISPASKDIAIPLVDNVLTFSLIIILSVLSHKRQSSGQPFSIGGVNVSAMCKKILSKYFTTTNKTTISTTSTVTTPITENNILK